MAEYLHISENGGARYEAVSGLLLACPFCGNEFSEDVFNLMIHDEEMFSCPTCRTMIYKEQFYVPVSLRMSY